MTAASLLAASSLVAEVTLPLYQNDCVRLEIARNPLSKNAVEISLKQQQSIGVLKEECFADVWKTRFIAEQHLADAGYENRLCYSKLTSDASPSWQVVGYSSLPWYLDNLLFSKIYSIWKQATVLFRTSFSSSVLSEKSVANASSFWQPLELLARSEGSDKNGTGALTRDDVIQKQLVHPASSSSDDNEIQILYNYAPLRTGGEQMHFLLVPQSSKPAKNFLELDEEQYINVLSLTQKVALWAEKEFGDHAVIHFLDKTGEIAGQTQPLYHAHLIIVTEEKEETWGKLAMFFKMLVPLRPLPGAELERRIRHYQNTLGSFLAHQD
jgi:diadenosine tetraphosphate (Ap4A) HIT family hydrolase